MPHSLLSTGSPISNPARLLYEGAGCPVDTDLYNLAFVMHQGDGTLTGEREFDGTNPLGDPVVFSTYLIGQLANNPKNFLSSFNLDADRGYGYLCWDWERVPSSTGGSQPKDGMNHVFPPPVTWPEGSGSLPGDPPPKPDPGVPFWTRPKPAPVGPNLYSLAMRLQYPGRSCVQGGGGILT